MARWGIGYGEAEWDERMGMATQGGNGVASVGARGWNEWIGLLERAARARVSGERRPSVQTS